MLTKIETQARKKAKLTRYMDVLDFQLILLLSLVLPFMLWFFLGLGPLFSLWPAALFIAWLIRFKVDKPSGYWSHFVSHQLRGKNFTGYNGYFPAKQCYTRLKETFKKSY
jgi:hypothetical protein